MRVCPEAQVRFPGPNQLAIIDLFEKANTKTLRTSAIVRMAGIDQKNASGTIRRLEKYGVIKRVRRGVWEYVGTPEGSTGRGSKTVTGSASGSRRSDKASPVITSDKSQPPVRPVHISRKCKCGHYAAEHYFQQYICSYAVMDKCYCTCFEQMDE